MINSLIHLWERFNRIPAPVPTDSPTIAPPALKQEQFADLHAQVAQEDARVATLYRRVVATNNRAVDRDYGTHVVDETKPHQHHRAEYRDEPQLTAADFVELAALRTGVTVMKEAP